VFDPPFPLILALPLSAFEDLPATRLSLPLFLPRFSSRFFFSIWPLPHLSLPQTTVALVRVFSRVIFFFLPLFSRIAFSVFPFWASPLLESQKYFLSIPVVFFSERFGAGAFSPFRCAPCEPRESVSTFVSFK